MGKKNTISIIGLLVLIIGMVTVETLGFTAELKTQINNFLDSTTAYSTIYTAILLFLVYVTAALILLQVWSFIINRLKDKLTKTALNTLNVLGRLVIIPFAIIAYLNTFPAFQGTLLGLSAILGTAIGFASTNTIGNFLSGLYIMASRPFLIGDYIILPGTGIEGVVIEISINYTRIELPTGNTVLIANNKFMGQSITNTRDTTREKPVFVYPLMWGVSADDKHSWSVNTINKTNDEYKDKLIEPATWFVSSRDRLSRNYQINIKTSKARKLLDLTSDYLTDMAKNYEMIKD